jgi:hypothetical protein
MALTPRTDGPTIEQAFLADRAMFWNRFTGFTKWAVIAVAVLLIALWLFLG